MNVPDAVGHEVGAAQVLLDEVSCRVNDEEKQGTMSKTKLLFEVLYHYWNLEFKIPTKQKKKKKGFYLETTRTMQ